MKDKEDGVVRHSGPWQWSGCTGTDGGRVWVVTGFRVKIGSVSDGNECTAQDADQK